MSSWQLCHLQPMQILHNQRCNQLKIYFFSGFETSRFIYHYITLQNSVNYFYFPKKDWLGSGELKYKQTLIQTSTRVVPKTTAVLISFLQVFCASAIFSLQLCNTQCVSTPACHYVDLGAREQGGGHWISVSWIWHICITDTIWNRAVHTKHNVFF